jgi:quinol monooxygenase YgiN
MKDKGDKMVKVVFRYDVSVDNQPEYLEVTATKIRPFWESHGCKSYSLWQVTGEPTAFVKEMVFENLTAMEKSMSLQEAKPIKDLFFGFASNVSRKVCVQKI